jgi:3-hydroxybutyryl-CoA dehydrogenase
VPDDGGSAGVVGVVGAGTMGAGIAQVALEAGWEVRIHDVAPGAVDRARQRAFDGLVRRRSKELRTGSTDGADPLAWSEERLERLTAVASIGEVAPPGTDLVIEAALEEIGVKQDVFAALDEHAPPDAVLATNTSALSVTRIAEATYRPARVVGLHFFNPAPLMRLVEVVSHANTDPAVAERAQRIVAGWGKVGVRTTDAPGFIVNRVNRAFTLEPLRLLRAGVASVEEIDAELEAAGFPMGPFRLMDLVGLDVNLATARNLFEAFGDAARFRPSPIQEALVAEGRLGRKTGEGFYRYDENGISARPSARLDDLARLRQGARADDDGPSVAERTILAIVAEAYRAHGEGVASSDDIDLALRLGANHPFGPFEWARRTGVAEVALMLDALAEEDADTFRPAMALLREAAG